MLPVLRYDFPRGYTRISPRSEDPLSEQHDAEWYARCYTWQSEVFMKFSDFAEDLPPEERQHAWKAFAGRNISSNFADASDAIAKSQKKDVARYIRQSWDAWKATGFSGAPPTSTVADFEREMGVKSKMSLEDLTGYRGGDIKRLSKVPAGAAHAFVSANPDLHWFDPSDGPEGVALAELARVGGGAMLATWTSGMSVVIWVLRDGSAFGPVVLRLLRDGGAPRRGSPLAELGRVLEGTSVRADLPKLEEQLARPAISVREWFGAFGIPSIPELRPGAEVWDAFASVAAAHEKGEAAPADALRSVNRALAARGEKLPSKPKKKELAASLAAAADVLRALAGPSKKGAAYRRAVTAIEKNARAMLDTLPASRRASSAEIGAELGHRVSTLRYVRRFVDKSGNMTWSDEECQRSVLAIRVTPPERDDAWGWALAGDLERPVGSARCEDGVVTAWTESDARVDHVLDAIGDAPEGTRLAIAEPEGRTAHYELV